METYNETESTLLHDPLTSKDDFEFLGDLDSNVCTGELADENNGFDADNFLTLISTHRDDKGVKISDPMSCLSDLDISQNPQKNKIEENLNGDKVWTGLRKNNEILLNSTLNQNPKQTEEIPNMLEAATTPNLPEFASLPNILEDTTILGNIPDEKLVILSQAMIYQNALNSKNCQNTSKNVSKIEKTEEIPNMLEAATTPNLPEFASSPNLPEFASCSNLPEFVSISNTPVVPNNFRKKRKNDPVTPISTSTGEQKKKKTIDQLSINDIVNIISNNAEKKRQSGSSNSETKKHFASLIRRITLES